MASLFERLFPTDPATDNIPVHGFHAAITEYIAGEINRNHIIMAWDLDTEAQNQLDTLLAAVDALVGLDQKLRFVAELNSVMTLAELKLRYTTPQDFATRLGL